MKIYHRYILYIIKISTLKYRGAFALAAKIAGLLPYGAFALQPGCVCFSSYKSSIKFIYTYIFLSFISAYDEPGSEQSLTGYAEVRVMPKDINDNVPVFNRNFLVGHVAEHSEQGTIGNKINNFWRRGCFIFVIPGVLGGMGGDLRSHDN